MEYFPTMKISRRGSRSSSIAEMMAEKFGFYDHCLFHTTVQKTEWDEVSGRWTVFTDRGDAMRARFVILANGILTTRSWRGSMEPGQFRVSRSIRTRWNYNVDLEGKRVGIIGTGTTAVQVIPRSWPRSWASCTCSSGPRRRSTSADGGRDAGGDRDVEERAGLGAGPPRPLRPHLGVAHAVKANDDYLAGRVADFRETAPAGRRLSPEEWTQKQLDDNFAIMEQIRARVDAIVKDPQTAASFEAPFYPYGCKRPTFHDEYLPSFNLPHVHLVDTAPMGVQRINERGVVHNGTEYPLDVLIYATGFQWMAISTFNMIVGRGGRTLTEKWRSEGTRTFLGIHSEGFRTCSS